MPKAKQPANSSRKSESPAAKRPESPPVKRPESPPAKSAGSAAPKRKTAAPSPAGSRADLSPEQIYRLIQETAYYKAKARGFAPGREMQDWIEAEVEVRRRIGRSAL